jgi:hydrogenase maturation protease
MKDIERSFPGAAHHGFACAREADPPLCMIAGLGNCLLRDDGVGVQAAWQLMQQPPAGSLVLEVGTDVFSAAPWLERVPRVLAIDAMDAGGAPGTIYQCGAADVRAEQVRASLHEMGLLAVLEFVPRARWPVISVLGVQPLVIDYGLELSAPLLAVLPRVVEAARAIVARWNRVGSIPRRQIACEGLEPVAN